MKQSNLLKNNQNNAKMSTFGPAVAAKKRQNLHGPSKKYSKLTNCCCKVQVPTSSQRAAGTAGNQVPP